MRLDPAGRPFIGGALLLALVSGIALGWVPAVLFVFGYVGMGMAGVKGRS